MTTAIFALMIAANIYICMRTVYAIGDQGLCAVDGSRGDQAVGLRPLLRHMVLRGHRHRDGYDNMLTF